MTITHNVPQYTPKAEGVLAIGLDYDGTFTEDPELFAGFVDSATARGHRVVLVTFRGGDLFEEPKAAADKLGIPVIATCGKPKAAATSDVGVFIDVWIDDMPGLI